MSNEFEQVAAMLREAYDGQVLPPLRDWLEPTDAAGAYAVQAINTRYWQAQGRRIVGRKAGLAAVWRINSDRELAAGIPASRHRHCSCRRRY